MHDMEASLAPAYPFQGLVFQEYTFSLGVTEAESPRISTIRWDSGKEQPQVVSIEAKRGDLPRLGFAARE